MSPRRIRFPLNCSSPMKAIHLGSAFDRVASCCVLAVCLASPFSSLSTENAPRCADPCECQGSEETRKTVSAAAVVKCIASNRPVLLFRVNVVGGDIDLSRLPSTRFAKGALARLPGVLEPRAQLGLDALERELGRPVPGGRVIRQQILVRDSVINGALIGPPPIPGRVGPYYPLVFLQTVDLTGTVVKGAVALSYSRFRFPLLATNATFERELIFGRAWFADNLVLGNAIFQGPALFHDTRYERDAVFVGVNLKDGTYIDFTRAVFQQGAWFQGEGGPPTRLRNANFFEATFEGAEANFEAASFEGEVTFSKARFARVAWFGNTQFAGLARFDGTIFNGQATFSQARFSGGADFRDAVFEGKVLTSLDGATFSGLAVFDGARFAGPSGFNGATFTSATFQNVEFGDRVDFRGANFESVEFGDARSTTTFKGPAFFDFARMRRAAFQNTQFGKRASFSGVQFGGGTPCGRDPPIAVDLSGSAFAEGLDLRNAKFSGLLNFAHVVVTPGQAVLRWDQVESRLISESVALSPDPACEGRKEFLPYPGRTVTPQAEVMRLLERNFRAQELLLDARKASYERENEETWAVVNAKDSGYLAKASLFAYGVAYGYTSGYGHLPERALFTTIIVLAAFSLFYFLSDHPLRTWQTDDVLMRQKITDLPWRSTDSLIDPYEGRAQLALWVSLAALTTVHVKGAFMLLAPTDRFRWVIRLQRLLGYVLIIMLGESLSNAVPLLHKLLGLWSHPG